MSPLLSGSSHDLGLKLATQCSNFVWFLMDCPKFLLLIEKPGLKIVSQAAVASNQVQPLYGILTAGGVCCQSIIAADLSICAV